MASMTANIVFDELKTVAVSRPRLSRAQRARVQAERAAYIDPLMRPMADDEKGMAIAKPRWEFEPVPEAEVLSAAKKRRARIERHGLMTVTANKLKRQIGPDATFFAILFASMAVAVAQVASI